jgi:GNAT superfamily N-acetyltransferase
VTGAKIRTLDRTEVDPHIPMLIADGFTPDLDEGTWIGAFVAGTLAGFVRVFALEGSSMLEDVYVFPEFRRRGIAEALIADARRSIERLWLICDDPMIPYYQRLGFEVKPKPDFPKALATLYATKGDWPEASDHNHTALCWQKTR